MEREFVSYEVALELKELGFDKPCIGRYYSRNKEIPIFMQWTKAVDFNSILLPISYPKHGENISPFISAPLWQQAFDWFRINFNLLSSIGFQNDYQYSYEIYDIKKKDCVDYMDKIDTYEESRLECLKKLIEIAKEQNVK